MNSLVHGERGFNILMVRSEADDSVLTPNEFRLYAHLARRAGAHGAWPAVKSMARQCRMHEDTVRCCLRRLMELSLIKARPRHGATTVYTLAPLSEWIAEAWNTEPHSSHRKGRHPRGNGDRRSLSHGESAFNILFIRAELDDYVLIPTEFRLYAHLARRAGVDGAWPAVKSMARTCRMHEDTVRRCLRRLKELNMVKAQVRPGTTTLYILTPLSDWKPASSGDHPSEDKGAPFLSEGTPPKIKEGGTPKGSQGKESHEGTPWKVKNTVGGGSHGRTVSPTLGVSDGRRPASGPPAMNGPCPSPFPRQENPEGGAPQTVLRRKAFAVASRIEPLHWDNCKVRYARHAVRSYAERAMQDGHDETVILGAYRHALRYTHGVATDEMDRGERLRHKLATPALTIYLARCHLAKDGKTVEQRREAVGRRIREQRHQHTTEDEHLHEEALRLAPEVAAWFVGKRGEAIPQGDPPSAITPTAATPQAAATGATGMNASLLPACLRVAWAGTSRGSPHGDAPIRLSVWLRSHQDPPPRLRPSADLPGRSVPPAVVPTSRGTLRTEDRASRLTPSTP
ncbi:MAG: helix-turn-helix domain-containing protein [Verrucomicrobiae bacterium]|nr:helix-turn-helix domain-containing protein [Verrucomicrobiae bacterium]